MITATNLTLRAGARTLLEGASFTVARGDRVGLAGRNGSGKTTLARVVAGEALPDGGRVVQTGRVAYLLQGGIGEGDMLEDRLTALGWLRRRIPFQIDVNRAALDVYNLGWKAYGEQRQADDRRRHREPANAEKKASALIAPG